MTECPVSAYDREASEVLQILSLCEGEFGGRSASSVLEETQYFFTVRGIVNQERARIEKMKARKKGKR